MQNVIVDDMFVLKLKRSFVFLAKTGRAVDFFDDESLFEDSGPLFKEGFNTTTTPKSNRSVKKSVTVFDLDLSTPQRSTNRPPAYLINCGSGLTIEVKDFKAVTYVCLAKAKDKGSFISRMNFPIDQIETFKKAVDAVSEHLKRHA